MKKLMNIVAIFLILFLVTFTIPTFAASLDSMNVTTSKQTVHPGENVTVNVAFGTPLGAYTIDVAYDNNLFEYVPTQGETENDNGTRVRATYYDQAGGTSPRESMSVTFKAKENIITSNPTDFSITAEGLSNPDASVNYDDITTPIVKNVIVEPQYVDYAIDLQYTGELIKNEEKDMKIVVASTMGKSYEHTRIIAEVTKPDGGDVELIGKDSQGLDHDIIQSGWGSADGDAIGGKDVVKELDVKGLFHKEGNYTIKLKLIDRENSDAEIVSNTFTMNVKEKASTPVEDETQNGGTTTKPNTKPETENKKPTTDNKTPTTLPKTGNTAYGILAAIIAVLTIAFALTKKKNNK